MIAMCSNEPTNTDNESENLYEIMKASPLTPRDANHVSKPQEPFCWRIPFVLSLLMMILLGSATFLTHKDINNDVLGGVHHNAYVEDSLSRGIGESSMTHVMDHSLKFWTTSVIKTVVIEVGAIALFQSVGMLPTLAKVLMTTRKVAKPWFLRMFMLNSKTSARVLFRNYRGGMRSPRMVRRLAQSVKTIYKRRSRLSAASDFTHVVGNEEENDGVDIAP